MSWKFNPFSRKPDYYEASSGMSVDDVARDNIVNLAWRLAIAEGLSVFNLEDGVVDEFEDETGVDTTASTYQTYNSSDDYYSPTPGATLDYMEYSSDANAQAAYVTNGTYETDCLPSGGTGITASSEYSTYYDHLSCDDNGETSWIATETTNGWVQVDLGDGVTKQIQQITITPNTANGYARCKNWELHASTDGFSSSDVTLTSGQHDNSTNIATYNFSNANSYRYYRLKILNEWHGSQYVGVTEWQLKELSLQSFSESTIKTQGSYSLKTVATTDSLGKTLTRALATAVDLSGVSWIQLDLRSNRASANVAFCMQQSVSVSASFTPSLISAGSFERFIWSLDAISNGAKNSISALYISIVNADASNTFYVDNWCCALTNMTLISESKEAEEQPTEARFLALVEPVDAITVNTDIKAYISEDDGSNYDEVTLTDEGYFDATKKILAGNVTLTDRSDKTMVQKIKTANSKDLKVHAWGMLWK